MAAYGTSHLVPPLPRVCQKWHSWSVLQGFSAARADGIAKRATNQRSSLETTACYFKSGAGSSLRTCCWGLAGDFSVLFLLESLPAGAAFGTRAPLSQGGVPLSSSSS